MNLNKVLGSSKSIMDIEVFVLFLRETLKKVPAKLLVHKRFGEITTDPLMNLIKLHATIYLNQLVGRDNKSTHCY
jgi:hypothetical protein